MYIVNVKKVLAEAEKPKPKPKIRVYFPDKKELIDSVIKKVIHVRSDDIDTEKGIPAYNSKAEILADITQQERDIHIARAKLSNKYHELEAAGASQDLFRENYQQIEAYTDELKELFNKKRHVERYGQLPEEPARREPSGDSDNIYELKEKRRSLNNRKHKAKKKLDKVAKYPPGSTKHSELLLEIDQIEAEQDQVNRKIARLETEA